MRRPKKWDENAKMNEDEKALKHVDDLLQSPFQSLFRNVDAQMSSHAKRKRDGEPHDRWEKENGHESLCPACGRKKVENHRHYNERDETSIAVVAETQDASTFPFVRLVLLSDFCDGNQLEIQTEDCHMETRPKKLKESELSCFEEHRPVRLHEESPGQRILW